jgi:N-acetylmuramoyl-L-alanine amidase
MHPKIPIIRFAIMLSILSMMLGRGESVSAATPAVRTVFIEVGHGGIDSGAVRYGADGEVDMLEKEVNLSVALKTASLLRFRGYTVVLSRGSAVRPGRDEDVNGDGRITNRDALQAVVDAANESGADVFLSLHSNSAWDATESGLEVYYCADREFAGESRRLAGLVLDNLRRALQNIGHDAAIRGVKDDTSLYRWRSWQGHLFVLGPVRTSSRRASHPRATQMPGALGEALFMSNDEEAAILASEEGQWALARGYTAAVEAYFAGEDGGAPQLRLPRVFTDCGSFAQMCGIPLPE